MGLHRILLVEDEPDLVEVLLELLRDRGDDVEVAGSISEASERMRTFGPCVVVSDLTLPDGDGEEAARSMRAIARGIPLILMSAMSASDLQRIAALAGADGAICKPFNIDAFERAVEHPCPPHHAIPSGP